jgi:hypothetical protein
MTADELRERIETLELAIKMQDGTIDSLKAEQVGQAARLEAVLELHKVTFTGRGTRICRHCSTPYPCPTRRTLTEETP